MARLKDEEKRGERETENQERKIVNEKKDGTKKKRETRSGRGEISRTGKTKRRKKREEGFVHAKSQSGNGREKRCA